MSFPDRANLHSGARSRRSPPQQGFGPGGINMYHQQQIQTALYQQQQIEFAQQQAQLEMHLQLEQMRLQNLALQEQIMIGQVHAQQAHAQAQAEQQQRQLHNTFYSTNQAPTPGRLTFTQGQGGLLAERALARRQQAEADALYAQCYPNAEEEDDVLRGLGGSISHYSGTSDTPHNLTPPAVVVSKPDEAFPLLVPTDSSFPQLSGANKAIKDPSQSRATPDGHFSSPSSAPSSVFGLSQGSGSPPTLSEELNSTSSPPLLIKKKFSDVVKSTLPSKPASSSNSNPSTAAPAPKLNPCSSVFVPGSTSGPDVEPVNLTTAVAETSPPQKVVLFADHHSDGGSFPGVYRAPRSKSPPCLKPGNRITSAPSIPVTQPVAGAMPTRQPRGPAAEAELTNQNFATRIRKRAIGAIKTLGSRPPTSPSPISAASSPNYQYLQQQQMLEALMMQQHQQQALAAAGYIDSDLGFHSNTVPSSGIAHLMATARAREERFGY